MSFPPRLDAARILCVEAYRGIRETRCAVLRTCDYDPVSASPHAAESLMHYQDFDLVIISGLGDTAFQALSVLSHGAEFLILEEMIKPKTLIDLVTERLDHRMRLEEIA